MIELLWLDGYCYFLDFLEILYYPMTSSISSSAEGTCFRLVYNTTIDELGNNDAQEYTGLSVAQ